MGSGRRGRQLLPVLRLLEKCASVMGDSGLRQKHATAAARAKSRHNSRFSPQTMMMLTWRDCT